MGLSEPHFRSATDNRLPAVDWNRYRKLSFAANSGMPATPGPLYGDPEPPGRHSPLPGLAFSQAPWIAPGPFSGPWCGFGFSSCPPHSPKSPSTSRFHGRSCESDDVAFFSLTPASSRRRAQVCTLPLPHFGWDSAPRSPPLQHRAPIPHQPAAITRDLCYHAPSGLLRGLPGVSFGRAFLPRGEFLPRSLSTSRFLRSGMGLSERFARSSAEQSLALQSPEPRLRKLSSATCWVCKLPLNLRRLSTPGRHLPLPGLTPLSSSQVTLSAFRAVGGAMISPAFTGSAIVCFQPHGSIGTDVESPDVAFFLAQACVVRPRAQVCTLPLSHSGRNSAPWLPPHLRQAPSLTLSGATAFPPNQISLTRLASLRGNVIGSRTVGILFADPASSKATC